MAQHRAVGVWKIYKVRVLQGQGIGLSDDIGERSKLQIKKTGNPATWSLKKKHNVTWEEDNIELTPDSDDEPTVFTGTVTIGNVEHSVRIELFLSEDEVLDDELFFEIEDDIGGIVAGTANSGRG